MSEENLAPGDAASSDRAAGASTSRSLIERLRSNEAPAWRRLVELYSPLIFHWCRRAGLPSQECPDVVQDIFRSVVTGIGGFRKQQPGDTFRGWLRTIARNKVNDYFRKAGSEPAAAGGTEANLRIAASADVDDEPLGDESDLRAEHELYVRAFEMIRRDFKEQTWQAFWRVVIDGRDAAEVAAELGMRPGTVRVAKSRVLKRLREQLGDLLEE
jgi:RNA polymerase sigma-70 factor (ECF subfamily)